MSFMLT
jgi:hypothetical protein